MKNRLILVVFMCILSSAVKGQGVPNGGFESWTPNPALNFHLEPDGWITTNLFTLIGLADSISVNQTSVAHTGLYAITAEAKESSVEAGAFTGTLNLIPFELIIGYQYGDLVLKVKGWYKYFPAGSDSGGVFLELHNNLGITVAEGGISFGDTVSTYTEFEFDVEYDSIFDCHSVDTAILGFTCSINNSVIGSVIYIDDITFEMTPVNQAPVAVDDYKDVRTSVTVWVDVLANDSDPDNDDLRTVDVTSAPSNGTVTIWDEDSIQYTPNVGFEGIDTFTYQITDAHNPSICATADVVINIWVTGIQDPNSTLNNPVLSPVPASQYLQLEFNDQFEKGVISIFDIYGRRVMNIPFDSDKVKFSVVDLSDGVYYYRLANEDGTMRHQDKFMVVR